MARQNGGDRYPVVHRGSIPVWVFIAFVGALLVVVLFRWAVLGQDPPSEWTDVFVVAPMLILLALGLFWIARIHSLQYVTVRPQGLLAAIPLKRIIPFSAIESVVRVDHSRPLGEYGWSTFLSRRLIPAWHQAPNVEVRFKRPVRLNAYPFPWFTLLLLTVDRPDTFVEELSQRLSDNGD